MPTNNGPRFTDMIAEHLDGRDVTLESVDVLATSDLDITLDPEVLAR